MKKRLLVLLLVLSLTLSLFACKNGNESQPVEAQIVDNHTYVAASVKEMTGLSGLSEGDTVILKGYSSASDGGGGQFVFTASGDYGEDGGTVFALKDGSGALVRLCEPDYRNICWFGASAGDAGDDSAAIQAAIDSLPATGGTVKCPGGTYMLFSTLNIGDGNCADKASTKNNIRLIGDGGYYGTTFKAASALDALVSINGSISGVEIDGIDLHGDLKADTVLKMGAVSNSRFANLYVFQFLNTGIELYSGSLKSANISENNSFLNICTITTTEATNNLVCLKVYGDFDAGNPVRDCTFTTCRFDAHKSENAVSGSFAYARDMSFYRCHFSNYTETAVGVELNALKNDGFPKNLTFYDCSVDGIRPVEDDKHKISQITLYGYGTYDNETLSAHPMICGITDDGNGFSMKFKGASDSLPEKRASFQHYSNAEFSHFRLNDNNSSAAIRFVNGVTWTGGILYCPSYSDDTGGFDLTVYKWNGDYATTVAGEKLYTTSFENFKDNSWLTYTFDEAFGKGEYLLVLDNAHDTGFGVGVWTKGKGAGIISYRNGIEDDYGLVGEFYLE